MKRQLIREWAVLSGRLNIYFSAHATDLQVPENNWAGNVSTKLENATPTFKSPNFQ